MAGSYRPRIISTSMLVCIQEHQICRAPSRFLKNDLLGRKEYRIHRFIIVFQLESSHYT